jgi:hypothetical protein
MNYDEIRSLKRGDAVRGDTVLWVCVTAGGGAGMGQYPSDATVVFRSGKVLNADAWGGARLIHRKIKDA